MEGSGSDNNLLLEPELSEQIAITHEERLVVSKSIPKNTIYKDTWAVNLFEKWRQERKRKPGSCVKLEEISEKTLENMTEGELNETLALFICEVRKTDGTKYPYNSLHGIVAAIQHFLKTKGKIVKFFNGNAFSYLRSRLDALMKESASEDACINKKQPEPITLAEEETLWATKILGDENPQQLLDTLIYLFGMHFALKGGREHRNLRSTNSQITLFTDNKTGLKYLEYQKEVAKTHAGSWKRRKIQPKVTRAYENKVDKKRCVVRLYEKYMSLW